MTKAQQAERQEAIDKLREWIKPGDTVYTILDHVSRSGMSRIIRTVLLSCEEGKPEALHPNWAVGKALGISHGRHNGRQTDGLRVDGCGMDMGFDLVYNLSYALYGRGYQCLGKGKCPSAYHSNHRNFVSCEGTMVYNPDGPNTGDRCWKPDAAIFSRSEVPADWPRNDLGHTLYCLNSEPPYVVCPTCKGAGHLPNPEGPERFDLTHTDGYALRQRWL